MLTAQENELLCRVEGQAPMGRLMRRYWVPVLLSREVAKPDGPQVRVQILGEKLLAFFGPNGEASLRYYAELSAGKVSHAPPRAS